MDNFTHPNLQLVYNKQTVSQRKSIKQYDLNNNIKNKIKTNNTIN